MPYNHLLALARTSGIHRSRVDEVIEAVGLAGAARRRAGRFSLGMGQRLGIATALLGDPRTVILDEPLNGLDTEGIRWVRALLQSLAAEGRTVFVSSHLMNEMALTAQHLIIIGKGRLIADTSTAEFIRTRSRSVVWVRTTHPDALAALLSGPDVEVSYDPGGALTVSGLTTDQIGAAAGAAGITLLELATQRASLEEAFIDPTRDAVEYRAEWTKLRSLPSTIWCLLATVVLVVGVGLAYATLRVARPPANPSTFDSAAVSLAGVQLAQFAIGVLGVLFITGEYATGSIRSAWRRCPAACRCCGARRSRSASSRWCSAFRPC